MALKSMTGFSRSDGGNGTLNWYWEIRTVNGRGLDIRLRLPVGYEALEQKVREACKRYLARGNCSISLTIQSEGSSGRIRLNEDAFGEVVEAANLARKKIDGPPPSLDGLLAIKGVIEFVEPEVDEAEAEARECSILDDLEKALEGVVAARSAEGKQLTDGIAEQVDEIESLTTQIEAAPARAPEAIQLRLGEQVSRLLQETDKLDEQRLHQEAALLAAKADIQEEIDRLKAHITAARDLLASGEPAGRRLEFLTQEFNRETNTICSKSNDTQISKDGLALKAIVDRMREQVQNIE